MGFNSAFKGLILIQISVYHIKSPYKVKKKKIYDGILVVLKFLRKKKKQRESIHEKL